MLNSDRNKNTRNFDNENLKIINFCNIKLSKDPKNKKALFLRASIYIKNELFEEAEIDLKNLLKFKEKDLNSTIYYFLAKIYQKKNNIKTAIKYLTKSIEKDENNINALYLRGALYNIIGNTEKGFNDYNNALKKDTPNNKKNIYKNILKFLNVNNNNNNESSNHKNKLTIKNIMIKKNNIFTNIYNSDNNNSNNKNYNNHNLNKIDIDKEINNYINDNTIKEMHNERTNSLFFYKSTLNQIEKGSIDTNKKTNFSDTESNEYHLLLNDCTSSDKTNSRLITQENKKIFSDEMLSKFYNSNDNNNNKNNNVNNNNNKVNNKNNEQCILNISNITDCLSDDSTSFLTENLYLFQNTTKSKENNNNNNNNNKQNEIPLNTNENEFYKNMKKWEILYNKGIECRKNGELEKSLEYFTESIIENRNNFKTYFNRGFTYYKLNFLEESIEDYNQSIKLNPNYSYTYYNRGIVYDKMKQYKNSIKDFTTAIELNNNKLEFYFNRGSVYKIINQYSNAIEDFTFIIENLENNKNYNNENFKKQNYFYIFYTRAICYEKINNYELAIKDFEHCVKMKSYHVSSYNHLANLYSNINNYEKSLENYEKII